MQPSSYQNNRPPYQGDQSLYQNNQPPYQGNQPPYYNNKRRNSLFERKPLLIIVSIVLLTIALLTGAFAVFNHSRSTYANGIGNSGVRTLPTMQSQQQKGIMQSNGPITTINGLARLSVVGSTAFILDAHGHTISTDANPYGVAIAAPTTPLSNVPGSLKAGDIVVTNFGATETGTTLVRFPGKMGPGHLFNTMANPGTKGPSAEAFNTSTGTDWVANTSGNNVQIFKPDGTLLTTVTSTLFNRPWGQAFNHGIHNPRDGSVTSFFSTNAADGTIDRIDVIPTNHSGLPTFKVYQIGQLAHMGKETFIAVTWIPSLQMHGHLYSDVLLATDPVTNRIAAYPNSTTQNTTTMRSTNTGITVFQGLPLRTPAGFTINPLNGDLLVVNVQRNDLVELNMSQGKVVGDRLLDNVPVDPMSGTGSALFGVAATTDAKGNLAVFFTDDNTNTLDELSV